MNDVLIINGNLEEQEAIAAGLKTRGIAYQLADSEHEAVLSMQATLPSIIVWDWPARDIAPEIFLAILRQEGFCGTILICSASLNVDDIPFDLVLKKPYEVEHLASTVRRLLTRLDEPEPSCTLREA